MTFKAARLLGLLKDAQMYEDSEIMIDFDDMSAATLHIEGDAYQEASLRGFKHSIFATLDHLRDRGYVDYDHLTGIAKVTHAGWNATSMTVKAAVQFTVRDIIVPLLVTIAATVLLRFV